MTPTALTAPRTTLAPPSGRVRISGLLRAEWTKLWSVRSTPWALGAAAVIGVGLAALGCDEARAHWTPGDAFGFDPARVSLIGVFFAQLVIGVLGILVMSAEHSTGTIRAAIGAVPRRLPILAAKIAVFGTVALVVGEILALVSFFVGQALLTAPAFSTTLGNGEAVRAVVGSGLYLALLGVLALGLAAIIRHSAGTIGAFVGVVLVLPIIVSALPSSLAETFNRFLPLTIGRAVISASASSDLHAFAPWAGLALLAAYAASACAAGALLFLRRDA